MNLELMSNIAFAKAGIEKIKNTEDKSKYNERLEKITSQINISVDDILFDHIKHFNDMNQIKVVNSVSAVMANIGTIAHSELNENNAA